MSAPHISHAPDTGPPQKVVFLLDVDNTLLDNDRVSADLRRYLTREVREERAARWRMIFEELRAEPGYADYLGALQRYRYEHPRDPHLLAVSSYLVNYPFANRLYSCSLDLIERFQTLGTPSSSQTAMLCFSRARSSAPGCSTRWNETS